MYAFTQRGCWRYLEYPDVVNTAGSYLYEPAGSVHTLHVPDDNDGDTDVWFTIHGANLNLDAEGKVELVIDAHSILPLDPMRVRGGARHCRPRGRRHRELNPVRGVTAVRRAGGVRLADALTGEIG